MIKTIFDFLKSIVFFKSITVLFAALVPIGLFAWIGEITLAFSAVIGVFLCAPSDVTGSTRHMAVGILVSCVIAAFTTLAMHLSFASTWVLLPVMSLLVFFNSMLSVYGFRASLVSFSGLLAIILSFALPQQGPALLIHVGLILAGGIWYLCVAMLAHRLAANRHYQLILSECMQLTADYLHTRGRLVHGDVAIKKLQDELFQLQTQINEKHETLREIFVAERKRSGSSHFANKYILIFIELVDILELIMSIPVDHPEISRYFAGDKKLLQPFAAILEAMSVRLKHLAAVVSTNQRMDERSDSGRIFEQAEDRIRKYMHSQGLSPANQEVILLRNLLDYVQKQQQKIDSIEQVLDNLVDQQHILFQSRDTEQFITPQDYDPSLFRQNLNVGSSIFRHAVRLTVTVLCGYALGTFLPVQNPYWIMLTIIVIMRPNYGLTKSRSMQRVLGTLIGAAIALGIILITQNPVVYGLLAMVSLVFAFSLVQQNYSGSAVFVTLNVVFLYALIHPDAFSVVQFRVYDTVIGSVLAFLAVWLLWPSWEFTNIRKVIADNIEANRLYLIAISNFYQQKGELPTSYKLARKEAFLAFGHLNSAFQRMVQEPKSKQVRFSETYQMVVLNHTFLAASASLGTFIQTHPTTGKSTHFQAFMDAIDHNLLRAVSLLNHNDPPQTTNQSDLKAAATYLDQQYERLAKKHRDGSYAMAHTGSGKDNDVQLQEVNLVSGQLKWLHSLAENIRNAANELSSETLPARDQPLP